MKTHEPHDLGRKFLVEECQGIDINSLLRSVREKLKAALLATEIEASGVPIGFVASQSTYGTRYWLKCSLCGRGAVKLYIHPISQQWGCRRCLGLEYRSRRFKGMVEG